MDDVVADLVARLGGVDLAGIVLPAVFLTVPGVALAKGLKRFRTPGPTGGQAPGEMGYSETIPDGIGDGGRGRQVKARLQRVGVQVASFVTIVAMLLAGLGLVPMTRAVYQVVSGVHEAAPATIGLIAVALGLVKGIVVAHALIDGKVNLMDRKVDKPLMWMVPVPLLALLAWVAPVVADQITDQAGQTAKMIVDSAKADWRSRQDEPPDKDEPDEDEPGKGDETDGGR